MKQVVLTVKLIITIGATSLLLVGCQNATLNEITKRTSSVAQEVAGNKQRVGAVPTNLEITQGSSSTEMIVTWRDGGIPGSIYRIDRSSDGGRSWQLRSRVASGVETYRDKLPKGGGRFLYRIRVEKGSLQDVEIVERGAVQLTHQQQLAEEREIKEAQKREEEERARQIAAAELEEKRLQAEKDAREEAERLAAEEAEKARLATEKAAREEAERAAELKAKQQAELQAREEKRKKLEKRKKAEAAILDRAEKDLEKGDVSAVEKSLKEYREKKGKSADKVKRYSKLKQKVVSMKQVLDDLEQVKVAEQYMKQGTSSNAVKSKKKKSRGKSSLLGKSAEGWVVQVATYPESKKRDAYSMLSTVKKSGFKSVFLKRQELAGRVLYRIRLGAYGNKEEAVELQEKINGKMADKGVASRVIMQKK